MLGVHATIIPKKKACIVVIGVPTVRLCEPTVRTFAVRRMPSLCQSERVDPGHPKVLPLLRTHWGASGPLQWSKEAKTEGVRLLQSTTFSSENYQLNLSVNACSGDPDGASAVGRDSGWRRLPPESSIMVPPAVNRLGLEIRSLADHWKVLAIRVCRPRS
jgi:hypothetical protein